MTICLDDGFLSSRKSCEMKLKSKLLFDRKENFSTKRNCSCLPTCDTIKYNVVYNMHCHNEGNETILNFILNTDDLIMYKRYQQFTASDVVSYVGGLLVLFAGISVMSIIELIYFVIFRMTTKAKP